MQFPTTLLALSALAISVSATPRQYNTFSIAAGTGGTAQAEAEAAFPGSLSGLSAAALSDVNTEAHCAVLAEASFISAQSAAGASTAAGKALAVGMIKNKVLKIYSTLQAVESQIALQGSSASLTAHQTDLQTKLAANIAIDKKNAGAASTAVSFTCP
ncbi:hypothetical protein BP6252_07419 [Coleophoma cylindrospora]|uniref:Cell wall protein n=1 Tax=Coleophoma cylindrospora TaxID=1849047 RepID=A0A3D8RHI5_9HELO|nr:hypothetical protein BP6252_07419 [Coleophoma cylindrospora]